MHGNTYVPLGVALPASLVGKDAGVPEGWLAIVTVFDESLYTAPPFSRLTTFNLNCPPAVQALEGPELTTAREPASAGLACCMALPRKGAWLLTSSWNMPNSGS